MAAFSIKRNTARNLQKKRREAMQEIEDGRFRIAQVARVSLLH